MVQDSNQDRAYASVQTAIEAVKDGRMVIMVDDEDRENEGDLVFAASHVTPEKINFMAKEARGLICLAMDTQLIDRLHLPMMKDDGKTDSGRSTAFTVSIEARHGVTTGISAADRCQTIKVAVHPDTRPYDLVVPGHVFPLRARRGGVLERAGHTEGSVDLSRIAGMGEAAVICEIMNDDGSMARLKDLRTFAQKHQMPIVSIADLIHYRLLRESLVEEISRENVEVEGKQLTAILFKSLVDSQHHFALVKGDLGPDTVTEVRVHRQRPFNDVFGHRQRIEYGLEMLQLAQHGVFLYLTGVDTPTTYVDELKILSRQPVTPTEKHGGMDYRTLGVGAQILRKLGVRKMQVHLKNPNPLKALAGFDLEIVSTATMPEGLDG